MPQFTKQTLAASDADWIAKINSMMDDIATAINTHHQEILSQLGPGALLTLDMFDRPGVVGSHSYQLDIENYGGGAQIDIGRRPTFDAAKGETDLSIAWINAGGTQARVTQSGDVELDATQFLTGLPKTIYVGVPVTGAATLYQDTTDPNVLYLYSMTWDGANLTDIKRRRPILPGYELFKEMAGEPRVLQVYDGDTNWVDGPAGGQESETEIVSLGDPLDNEIGISGQIQALAFVIHAHRQEPGSWWDPTGDPPDSIVTLKIVDDEGDEWSDPATPIEIDVGQVPDSIFVALNPAIPDDKEYMTEIRRLHLELVSIGSTVVSARGFTWGLIYRPLLGAPVPKDGTEVDLI